MAPRVFPGGKRGGLVEFGFMWSQRSDVFYVLNCSHVRRICVLVSGFPV